MKWTLTVMADDINELESISEVIGLFLFNRANKTAQKPMQQDNVKVKLKDPDTGEIHTVTRQSNLPAVSSSGTRLCDHCGTAFVPKRKDSRFCGKKCAQAAYSNKYLSKSNNTSKKPKRTKTKPSDVDKMADKEQSPSQKGNGFIMKEINGKMTQIFGTPAQLENFEKRLIDQDETRRRKYKKLEHKPEE